MYLKTYSQRNDSQLHMLSFIMLTLTMLDIFMYYTPPQVSSNPVIDSFHRVENIVDTYQLASQNPADLDLYCFQTRIYSCQHDKSMGESS